MYRVLFFLLLLFLPGVQTSGQSLKFRTFPNEKDLRYKFITTFYEDTNGFLWVGTDNGAWRNDGNKFHQVTNKSTINSFLGLNNGNVLAGSTEGLIKINKWGIPHTLNIGPKGNIYIAGNAGKHTFWCITLDKIFCVDEQLNILTSISSPLRFTSNKDFDNSIQKTALSSSSGKLFMVSENKIVCFSFDNNIIVSDGVVYKSMGRRLLLSRDNKGEIICFDRISGSQSTMKNLISGQSIPIFLSKNASEEITNFSSSINNQYYFCSAENGLFLYDAKSQRKYLFRNNIFDDGTIPDNTVFTCMEDRNHCLWVGTPAGIGLSQAINTQFQYYFFTGNADNHQLIHPVYTDVSWISDSTCLLFSTGQSPIIKLCIPDGHITYMNMIGNTMPQHIIRAVEFHPHEWILSATNGLFFYDDSTGYLYPASAKQRLPEIFSFPAIIKGVFIDSFKNTYISFFNHHNIYKFDIYHNQWETLGADSADSKHFFPLTSFVAATSSEGLLKGDYFINDDGKQLAFLNQENGDFTSLQLTTERFHERFIDITADYTGQLWLASEKYIFRLDPEHLPLKAIEIQGVSRLIGSGKIKRIISSGNDIWITTDAGLIQYRFNTNSIEFFDSGDGLIEESFGYALRINSNTKEIISTTSNGVVIFHPANLKKRSLLLKPVFLGWQINGKVRDPEEDHQRLSYDERNIRIHFGVPQFRTEHLIYYRYKLEGYQVDWSAPLTQNFLEFYQLPAGKYNLLLRASADGFQWQETISTFSFRVEQPLYLHPLFILGCLLFIAGGVILYLYEKHKVKLKQFMIAQEIRNNISRDLHDDLGSALSSISFISDMGQQSGLDKARKYHQLIGDTSRSMIDAINDIVWVVNPKNDSMESLIYRMRRFSSTLFEARNIRLSFRDDESLIQLQLPMNMRRNIYMIFKEIVNNTAKHSEATEVTIDLIRKGQHMLFRIADNGKGFDKDAPPSGNGLLNIQARALEINALLVISSTTGAGSIFELSVLASK